MAGQGIYTSNPLLVVFKNDHTEQQFLEPGRMWSEKSKTETLFPSFGNAQQEYGS